jgi:hypothetical protein
MRSMAVLSVVVLSALAGCMRNDPPSGPRRLIPPSYAFTAGQIVSYTRRNFDQNYNPTSSFQHDVEVLASGLTIGGFPDAATVKVTSSGGSATRIDTVAMAVEGGRLMIYDGRGQAPGGLPQLPLWNTLFDLDLNAASGTGSSAG